MLNSLLFSSFHTVDANSGTFRKPVFAKSTCCLFNFFKYLQIWIFTEIHCGFYYVSTVICAFVQTFFRVQICLKISLIGFNFFPFFVISHVTNSVVAKQLLLYKKKRKGCGHYAVFHHLYLEHWDYHAHPHVHPAEFENLQESNFTELQNVQALHPSGLLRHDTLRYEAENLLDPNLAAHSHVLQQPVSPQTHKTQAVISSQRLKRQ